VKLDDTGWQAELLAAGKELAPRLFVFDPLARMKASERNESEQKDMSPVIDFWRELRDGSGAAVALVNHTGHQGEHIRGTSDLETAWETRLHWSKSGSEVTIKSEHRDADSVPEFKYRIAWDAVTRSMRFEAVEDPFASWVRDYYRANPEASANDAYKAADGRPDRPGKTKALAVIKSVREGGSERWNQPGTTPSDQRQESGSQECLFEAPGTTRTGGRLEMVPSAGTGTIDEDEIERLAALAREMGI
jgi:hypothetical protein